MREKGAPEEFPPVEREEAREPFRGAGAYQ